MPYRSAGREVHVKAYTRGDGTRVAAHTRSAPDGDLANNLISNLRTKGEVKVEEEGTAFSFFCSCFWWLPCIRVWGIKF